MPPRKDNANKKNNNNNSNSHNGKSHNENSSGNNKNNNNKSNNYNNSIIRGGGNGNGDEEENESVAQNVVKTPIATTTAKPGGTSDFSSLLPAELLAASTSHLAVEQRQQLYVANSKLCQLVCKCPWMYDRNNENYGKKQILDQSWAKIAMECNDSVASCKERWRNIRAAFARSINIYKTQGGPNRVKPYYLHNELLFLIGPMMRDREKSLDLNDDSRETEQEATLPIDNEDVNNTNNNNNNNNNTTNSNAINNGCNNSSFNIDSDSNEAANYESTKNGEVKLIRNETENIDSEMELSSDEETERNFSAPVAQWSKWHAEAAARLQTLQTLNTYCQQQPQRNAEEEEENEQLQQPVANKIFNHGGEFQVVPLPMITATTTITPNIQPASTTSTINNTLTHPTTTTIDGDVKFLEALLVDMRTLNARQKISFKRKVYQSLEEVSEVNTSPATAQQVPNENPCYHPTAKKLMRHISDLSETDLYRLNAFMHQNFPPRMTFTNNDTHSIAATPATVVDRARQHNYNANNNQQQQQQQQQRQLSRRVSNSANSSQQAQNFILRGGASPWVPITVKVEPADVNIS